MISLAIGAETVPPVAFWFWSTTAIATLGSSTGAKAMNQAVFRPATPVSAVPVLPATRTPEIRAAVPVPPETTPSIIPAIWSAISGFTERRHHHPLLTESEPSRVDAGLLRPREQLAALIEAARRALPSGQVDRRIGVEAKTAGVVEDLLGPELLPHFAERRVDRVDQGLAEVDRPERRRRVVVVHALAVLDAVARVVEGGLRRIGGRVERGRGRD